MVFVNSITDWENLQQVEDFGRNVTKHTNIWPIHEIVWNGTAFTYSISPLSTLWTAVLYRYRSQFYFLAPLKLYGCTRVGQMARGKLIASITFPRVKPLGRLTGPGTSVNQSIKH